MNITQCSLSKTAFQTVTLEGPDITTFGFVTDTYIQGIDAFSGNLWKSATSSPPELKEIETWQTTHFEDN